MDQDTLGRQATCYRDNGDYQIWVKPLANNEKAVCLLNKSDEKKSVLVDFALLAQIRSFFRGAGGGGRPSSMTPLTIDNYRIRDLWEHKDITLKETSVSMNLHSFSKTLSVYQKIIPDKFLDQYLYWSGKNSITYFKSRNLSNAA